MTAHIYSEQNAHRPASATFAHFVEVCGILTIHARKKKREELSFVDALCKALGWYFPLLAKFKVASVEELIYRKYPYSCPYCREAPHVDVKCKTIIGTKRAVDHPGLRQQYVKNAAIRPKSIGEWQAMFDKIYPRNLDDSTRSIVALFEELGELAEAVRVFDRFPKYFVGEAADVFSYLMGIANEYNLQLQRDDLEPFDFEAEYIKRYPGLCVQCGYPVCICPLVPDSTVGRMAKELDIDDMHGLFKSDFEVYRAESIQIAERILSKVGGYAGLMSGFPFDRGEANHALVLFCLKMADKIQDKDVAERLRSAALKAGTAATYAGSPKQPERLNETLSILQSILQENKSVVESITGAVDSSLSSNVGKIIIQEYVAGDKYTAGTVGAQGAAAHAIDPKFESLWQQNSNSINIDQLASQLAQLHASLESLPPAQANAAAIVYIAEAEAAAIEGKGAKAMAALSKTGKWAFDMATKIGTDIAAAALKSSLGL
jgi:NTP pyrophosphatase (non-canonical NTP hydrolase)